MKSKRIRMIATAIGLLILSSVFLISVTSAQQAGWKGEYYNNTNLQGTPAHTRTDSAIFFDWNDGSPAPGVNKDNFSIRWSRTLNLPAGRYKFYVRTDDGSRLTVNNSRIIDKWYPHAPQTDSAEINLPGGNVPVVMEMFENGHNAEAHLFWERIGDASAPVVQPTAVPTKAPVKPPTQYQGGTNGSGSTCGSNNWAAEFWNNSLLKGAANQRRTDRSINFNWANGSAVPNVINADNWSGRWTSMHDLARGNYRLNVSADDGVVVYVNNKVVVNTWNQPRQRVNNPFYHEGGMVTMRVEYFDSTGAANLNMWCQAFTPTKVVPTKVWPTRTPAPRVWPTSTPVPPPPPTATPVPPPTATPDPRQTANAGECQICKVHKLNVRSAPDFASAIVTVVSNGEITTYTGNRQGRWAEIRTNDGEIGWINDYYCNDNGVTSTAVSVPAPVAQPQPQPTAHTVMVDVSALVVRACAGTNYDMRAVVYHGDNVQLLGHRTHDNAWVNVRTATGVEGWAYAPYLWLTNDDYNSLQIVTPSCGNYAAATTTQASTGVGTGTVNVNGLNLRAGAGFGYDILAGAYYGETYQLYGTRSADNLWVSVRLANGQVAWAYAPYLNLSVPISNLTVI